MHIAASRPAHGTHTAPAHRDQANAPSQAGTPCADDPAFVDRHGYTCGAWRSLACPFAGMPGYFGNGDEKNYQYTDLDNNGLYTVTYTLEEEYEIVNACPKSCHMCKGTGDIYNQLIYYIRRSQKRNSYKSQAAAVRTEQKYEAL